VKLCVFKIRPPPLRRPLDPQTVSICTLYGRMPSEDRRVKLRRITILLLSAKRFGLFFSCFCRLRPGPRPRGSNAALSRPVPSRFRPRRFLQYCLLQLKIAHAMCIFCGDRKNLVNRGNRAVSSRNTRRP